MATRKLTISAVDAGRPLGEWLAERIAVPPAEAAARVVAGAVYVDGERVREPERPLVARQKIIVHEVSEETIAMAAVVIVHQDGEVIVVDKAAGVPTQADRGAAAGALDEAVLARFPSARLLHRIDRDTSGLVMFTRADGARRAALQRKLTEGRLVREYLAVVDGAGARVTFPCTIDRHLGPDPADRRRRAVVASGGETARTQVALERVTARARLLRCRLETGRTHQIRVHLASVGLPILGDPLYAPAALQGRSPRLALHATRLTWPGGTAESPLPAELAALL